MVFVVGVFLIIGSGGGVVRRGFAEGGAAE
jgi:hypothetical protein